MRTLATKVRMLVSAVALSALAAAGPFLGTYRALVLLSEGIVSPVVTTVTPTSNASPAPPVATPAPLLP